MFDFLFLLVNSLNLKTVKNGEGGGCDYNIRQLEQMLLGVKGKVEPILFHFMYQELFKNKQGWSSFREVREFLGYINQHLIWSVLP